MLPLGYFDAYQSAMGKAAVPSSQTLGSADPADIAARISAGYGAERQMPDPADAYDTSGFAAALKPGAQFLPPGAPMPKPAAPPPASAVPPVAASPVPAGPPPAPAAPPGPQYIPGHVTSVPAHEVPLAGPTKAALMDKAYRERQGAAEEVHDTQRQEAIGRMGYIQGRSERVQDEIAAQEEAKAKHFAERKALSDQIAQEHQQMAATKAPDLQMPEGAGSMIAIFLGGLFPNADGSNPAIQAYQRQIDARLKQHQIEYAQKKDAVAAKETLYGRLVDEYGDSGAAEMLKANYAQRALLEADAIAARNGLTDMDTNYTNLKAKLSADRDEALANMITYVQGKAAQGRAMVFDPRVGVLVPAD